MRIRVFFLHGRGSMQSRSVERDVLRVGSQFCFWFCMFNFTLPRSLFEGSNVLICICLCRLGC